MGRDSQPEGAASLVISLSAKAERYQPRMHFVRQRSVTRSILHEANLDSLLLFVVLCTAANFKPPPLSTKQIEATVQISAVQFFLYNIGTRMQNKYQN
eukprot:3921807-Rhodomonas_salina.2